MDGHAHEMRNDPTVPRQLVDPAGEVLSETEASGVGVIRSISKPTIPTTVQGFSVRVGTGIYPPDAPNSHRRAVYADLMPVSPEAQALCRKMGRERVLGIVPLTPDGFKIIADDPGGDVSEKAALDALRAAVREIRRYLPDG